MPFNTTFSARLLLAVLLFFVPVVSHGKLCFCLKSTDATRPFALILKLPNEKWDHGMVRYKGSKQDIKIKYKNSEELERYEGRPSYMQYTWNEIVQGKVTGTYVLCIQGARIYDAWYLRKRDHKKFELTDETIGDDCPECD